MNLEISAPQNKIEATISLPLSKSESARRLVLDAFGNVLDQNLVVADCDDTNALKRGLATLSGNINIGAAGTAMRFLTAYYAATPGTDVLLDGSERMRHRPIAILVDALRKFGADIEYAGEEGFPPLRIRGKQLTGGKLSIDARVSSQFISAIIMAAPSMQQPVTLQLTNTVTSLPYLQMTVAMMARRGIAITFDGAEIAVTPGCYGTDNLDVEADWSAASYWFEVSALSQGHVKLPGLHQKSLQGDCAICKFAKEFGVDASFAANVATLRTSAEKSERLDIDMTKTPDIVQTLVVIALMQGQPFCFSGVHTLRNKETDRLQALCNEARKLGYVLSTDGDDKISWNGTRIQAESVPAIDTYDDHRMAMAFAPAALKRGTLVVRNAEVVSKSYPQFWDHLRMAGFSVTPTN
jgi:3-phosphoshikimate 1-carboxyvinyltransferase